MRFLILMANFVALCAFEFAYEQDLTYRLSDGDFSVKNGKIIIDFSALRVLSSDKETLKTKHSIVSVSENLDFYRHLKKPSARENRALLPLQKHENAYIARFNGARIPKNCFVLLKNAQVKTLATKSSAMVLDLGDSRAFGARDLGRESARDSSDSSNLGAESHADSAHSKNTKNSTKSAYFGCFGDGRYIF